MKTATKRVGVAIQLSVGQERILDRFTLRAADQPGTIQPDGADQTAWMLYRLSDGLGDHVESVLKVIDDAFADEHLCSIGLSLELIYLLWSLRHKARGLQSIEAFLPEVSS